MKMALILALCAYFQATAQTGKSKLDMQVPFKNTVIRYGGLERMDTTTKNIYLSFTGGDYNDGGWAIHRTLKKNKLKAHFFFTGGFYRNRENTRLVKKLIRKGHYLGAHSDQHLLYAAWENRDSLLVSKEEFTTDLLKNYQEMDAFGIPKEDALFFMPPYEWYNQQISDWTKEMGLILINFSPGTRSNADYTTPDMGERYISSDRIYRSIMDYEQNSSNGLNGFILLIHIGTHPSRTDKFYFQLPQLLEELKQKGYSFALLQN